MGIIVFQMLSSKIKFYLYKTTFDNHSSSARKLRREKHQPSPLILFIYLVTSEIPVITFYPLQTTLKV